jgi:hypothetical protein
MRRNRRWIVGLAATLVVAVGGAWFVLADDDATAQVEERSRYRHGDRRDRDPSSARRSMAPRLRRRAGAVEHAGGTLTGVAEGLSLARRRAVQVDERLTVLMLGEGPRTARSSGAEGKDVRQLRHLLRSASRMGRPGRLAVRR